MGIQEQWKDVLNYEGLYEVSNLGNCRACEKWSVRIDIKPTKIPAKLLKPNKHRDGYLKIVLSNNKLKKTFMMHRLVALSWIPNPNNLPQINHKDGNKLNNIQSNLEWVTAKENIEHAVNNNLRADVNGEKNAASILTTEQVLEIVKELKNCYITQQMKDLGLKYGVSIGTIYDISKGRRWSKITGITEETNPRMAQKVL